MRRELQGIVDQPTPPPSIRKPASKDLVTIDIAMIGAAGFSRLCRHKGSTVFTTSLYEIDKLIEEETCLQEETPEQLVERRLPTQYADYKDVFSKAALDQLLPHRSYDYKI